MEHSLGVWRLADRTHSIEIGPGRTTCAGSFQSLVKRARVVEIEHLQGPSDDVGWCSPDIDDDTVFIGS